MARGTANLHLITHPSAVESQQQLLNDITMQLESKQAGGAEQVKNLEVISNDNL